jgi:ligand-binding sensor domain-containing protein
MIPGFIRWPLAVGILFLSAPALAQAPAAMPAVSLPTLVESYQVGVDVYVRALTPDQKRQSMWIGTSVGVLEIDLASRGLKNSFTRKDGLASEHVSAIGVHPDGTVWFGTNGGGASTYSDGTWRTYFPTHGLADYWVHAFAVDRNRDVWIGTWDGASRFESKTGAFTTFRQELVHRWIYAMAVDRSGRVWFGTENGLSVQDKGRWRQWNHELGLGAPHPANLPVGKSGWLPRLRGDLAALNDAAKGYNPNHVFALLADRRDDGMWVGTWGGGVSRHDGVKTWRSYAEADGLAGSVVYSIAQEANGTLWFGTNRGASRFDGASWVNYGRKQGLMGDHVLALAVAPDGSIWFGTKNGVNRLAAQSVAASDKSR